MVKLVCANVALRPKRSEAREMERILARTEPSRAGGGGGRTRATLTLASARPPRAPSIDHTRKRAGNSSWALNQRQPTTWIVHQPEGDICACAAVGVGVKTGLFSSRAGQISCRLPGCHRCQDCVGRAAKVGAVLLRLGTAHGGCSSAFGWATRAESYRASASGQLVHYEAPDYD